MSQCRSQKVARRAARKASKQGARSTPGTQVDDKYVLRKAPWVAWRQAQERGPVRNNGDAVVRLVEHMPWNADFDGKIFTYTLAGWAHQAGIPVAELVPTLEDLASASILIWDDASRTVVCAIPEALSPAPPSPANDLGDGCQRSPDGRVAAPQANRLHSVPGGRAVTVGTRRSSHANAPLLSPS